MPNQHTQQPPAAHHSGEAEMLDIYDDSFQKIGTKERWQVHRDGDWHKTFHCWVIYRDAATRQDYVVVQRRAPDKALFPNLLDITAGGHYAAGETVEQGLREVEEELGIRIAFDSLIPVGLRLDVSTDRGIVNRELSDVFLLVDDRDLSAYPFQREEITALAVLNIDEALELCAGERPTIQARAVVAVPGSDRTVEEQIAVSLDSLVPSYDHYFYKLLVLAKRCLNGEKRLII